jgi:hypothetical protein
MESHAHRRMKNVTERETGSHAKHPTSREAGHVSPKTKILEQLHLYKFTPLSVGQV